MGIGMETLLPFLGMMMVILVQVSSIEVAKAAMSTGINKYIIVFYTNAMSSLFLLPCSLLFHRSVSLPGNSSSVLCRIILLSTIGNVSQICGYAGVDYSSPTLATAMLNLVPAFTFILAIIFRMETLNWRRRSCQAKSLGTLVSIAGAFVVTFYKGPTLLRTALFTLSSHQQLDWILGGFFLAIEAFLVSAWYTLQTLILKKFPAVFTVMFYVTLFGAILSGVYSLILVKDQSAWRLKPDKGLVAILYIALVGIVFRVSLCSWCLWKAGPLYASMFKPLAVVMAVIMDIIFLGDAASLGSLIGAAIIVTGFYAVMWGKANEENKTMEDSSEKVPLLQNRNQVISSSV